MENQEKTIDVAGAEAVDRRSSRLIRAIPSTDAFAGWGPRMQGSLRDVLRGMN